MLPILWFIACLLFLLLEMMVPGGFYFACLALGAFCASLASLLMGRAADAWILFFSVATLGVFTAAPMARRWLGRIAPRPVGFDSLIGQRARVTEAVEPASRKGLVQLGTGSAWRVVAETPLAAGTWVEVVGVTGTRLRVRPCSEPPRQGVTNA